jgi:hypothetical protein
VSTGVVHEWIRSRISRLMVFCRRLNLWPNYERIKPLSENSAIDGKFYRASTLTRCFLPSNCSPPNAPRPTNLETLSGSSSQVNGSLSQKLAGLPPPLQKIYLGFVFVIMSSIGGEPMFDNSAEGSGTAEKLVIRDGQSCETSTSIKGEETREDAMEERDELSTREETVLASNFETVCDV